MTRNSLSYGMNKNFQSEIGDFYGCFYWREQFEKKDEELIVSYLAPSEWEVSYSVFVGRITSWKCTVEHATCHHGCEKHTDSHLCYFEKFLQNTSWFVLNKWGKFTDSFHTIFSFLSLNIKVSKFTDNFHAIVSMSQFEEARHNLKNALIYSSVLIATRKNKSSWNSLYLVLFLFCFVSLNKRGKDISKILNAK